MTDPIAIIGGGPAGLMAAEIIAQAGLPVTLHDRMPTLGRKLLLAGRGGLNLTHTEALPAFLARYGTAATALRPALDAFPPEALMQWCRDLGQEVFTGSSGRVFPKAMKASPLLRAWRGRLAGLGVQVQTRHHWLGWDDTGALQFADGTTLRPAATVLAMGGASWPALGADGGWVNTLPGLVTPLQPTNCGFSVDWSAPFRARCAGQPLKRIAIRFHDQVVRGEAMVTEAGIEGGAIYALSSRLRGAVPAQIQIDLRPDMDAQTLLTRLSLPRRGQSLSTFLRKALGLPPVAIGLVQEALHRGHEADVATLIKACPVALRAPFPIARAISSAGGVKLSAVNAQFMLHSNPGVFVAGEMLDWEAPTGGYLLLACLATGAAAGRGVLEWVGAGT